MPQTDATPIARQFIQAWNAGQRNVVDDLAAPDLTVAYPHFPEPLEGTASVPWSSIAALIFRSYGYFRSELDECSPRI